MSDVATGSQQLVVFALTGEEYALPIERVQEIIDWVEPRSVAGDTAWMRGVIGLRGRIIPIYDVAARLGLAREEAGAAKIVIVEWSGTQAGLVVDAVTEVLTVEAAQLDELPSAGSGAIEAIAKVSGRLIALLSLDAVFADVAVVAAA